VATTGLTAPAEGGSSELRAARSVRGRTLIVVLSVIVAAFFVLNLVSARKNQKDAKRAKELAALMADGARVSQAWTETSAGMTASFVSTDGTDTVRVNDIRAYLRKQRIQHLRADYSDVRFEGRPLPGRPELEYGTENGKLNVRYRDVKGGGELSFIATDKDVDIMKQSLREWSDAVRLGPPS
jgi:preprotein translocase subunit YajC